MTQANRGRVIVAVFLVLLGLYLLAVEFVPGLRILSINENNWPLIVVGVGILFLLAALVTWTPNLMVPAVVVGGTGALLFWQNATNNWASWAYAWTLYPVFAGVGLFLSYVMQGNLRQGVRVGGPPILVGIVLFMVFGSFLGGLLPLGQFWPLILIVIGIAVLAQTFLRRA